MTAEIRAPQRLPQRRVIYTSNNQFDMDLSRKPADMAYRWSCMKVGDREAEQNIIMTELNGWTPVPANRHPELAGLRAQAADSIIRGNLMLVEQPIEYERESRELERFEAQNTLEQQVQRLGMQARRNGTRGVARTMEPVVGEIIE